MNKSPTPKPKFGHFPLVIGHWSLVIGLLCAVAIAPLLRGDIPCSHDGALHYFRVAAMRHALGQGLLFTRWLPDLAFGYGFPFFNYRAPLSYYLALGLHLAGLPLPLALNMVYVLSILGSALGAYLLARDIFGPEAGVVAAVAYAYAPYQFLDALLRANSPESVALALLPFVLWAFRRLALGGGRRWFLLAAGLLAAFYLNHNISSLLFTPLLLAYLGLLGWVYQRQGQWRQVMLALVLALGLTAFFWLPALAERGYVQLYLTRATRNNDFHYNFLGLAEIFAPPSPVDTSLMNVPMKIHLGLAQVVLAGIGLVVGSVRSRGQVASLQAASLQVARRWREQRASLLFFAASAALFIFMSTRASLWLWEQLPLLPFVQFPWRFIGRATLPLALLASATAPGIANPTQNASRNTHHVSRFTSHVSRFTLHTSRALPPIFVGVLILVAIPSTYPPSGYCPMAPHPTVLDVHRYEHESRLVGVDPLGSYFPIWAQQRPERSPLEEQYAAGGTIARFDEAALPEGAAVLEADYSPNHARLVVESPAPFRARYLTFYFPGWRVEVDGERVEVTATEPEGLISFDVPAGHHTVTVHFGETSLRRVADAISLLSLATLAAFLILHPLNHTPRNLQSAIGHCSLVIGHWSLVIVHCSLIPAALLLAFKLAVVDQVETPFRCPSLQADGTLPGVDHPLAQPYADGLRLIGYDMSATEMSAEGILGLNLYWTVRERPSRRYQTVVRLVGPEGFLWSHRDSARPRGYHAPPPTNTWEPGRYALDSHEVEPLPGTPPGTYDVVLTVFDRETLSPLSVLNEQGQAAAPELTLGRVTLTPPRRPTVPPARGRLDIPLGSLTLLTADFDRDQAAPGDTILLTTFWHADQQTAEDLTLHLALLAHDGSPAAPPAAEFDLPPTVPWHPTSTWQPGDTWRGQHLLHLPATLDSGDYTWTLRLSHTPTHTIAHISITAPPHAFTAPPVDIEVDTRLGNVATLLGAILQPETCNLKPGTPLTVTLVWRAEATASTSYHVFLHLLDPEERLIAQSDGIPAGWTRPTTGWLPGEYITDAHILTVPPDAPMGEYTLQAGLYVPGGERLTAPDGTNAIPLATITTEAP